MVRRFPVFHDTPLQTPYRLVYQTTRDSSVIECSHCDHVAARITESYEKILKEPTVPYKAYEALQERYATLNEQYSNLQHAHNKTVEKWRLAKAHIKTWETYHEKCKARERAKALRKQGAEASRDHGPDAEATIVDPVSNDRLTFYGQLEQSAMPSVPPISNPTLTPRPASHQQALAKPLEVHNTGSTSYSAINQRDDSVQSRLEGVRTRAYPKASIRHDDEADGLGHGANELPTPKGSSFKAPAGRNLRPDPSGYSSDQPVIVSERSLKKRKRNSKVETPSISVNRDVQKVGSVAKPIHVKSENNSSSPAQAAGRRGDLVMQDSLDLDDVGARLITPRKRRRIQEMLRLSQSNLLTAGEGVKVGQTAQEHPSLEGPTDPGFVTEPNMATKTSETNNQDRAGLFPDSKQPAGTGRNANIQRPQNPERLNNSAEEMSLEAPNPLNYVNNQKKLTSLSLKVDDDPVRASSAAPETGISGKHHPKTPTAIKAEAAKVLQPTNPNTQIQPRTSESRSTHNIKNQKSRRDRVADCVPSVTEDGENFGEHSLRRGAKVVTHGNEVTGKLPRQHDQEKVDVQSHRRLASLLDEPSPEKSLLSPTSPSIKASKSNSKSPSRSSGYPRIGDTTGHNSGNLRVPVDTPSRGRSPVEQLRKRRDRPSVPGQQFPPSSLNDPDRAPIDPDDEPLRARPLHRLGLDDFKINPGNNQGLHYAFTEVVRNHDQRRCLPGCTRPSCCGSTFRKLVEIGGLPTPRTSGLWSSSSPEDEDKDTQEQADARLLKEYLGADHDRRLKAMSEAERKEALLDAKTRAFADQHGRHRQAFERRATPPGFWRTDMPSTQEVEMDREEARVLERKRVEEMYREAMREGGRWRFRDE